MSDRPAKSLFASARPSFLSDPYPFYERLRAAGPVTFQPGVFGGGAWMVTGHAACSAALKDKHLGKEGYRVLAPGRFAFLPRESPEVAERNKNNLLVRDPPDHTRLRGLVTQAFTPHTVERLRPHVAEIADRLLDDVAATLAARGAADLLGAFAFPLPALVIAELLGVAPGDTDQFLAWSTTLMLNSKLDLTMDDVRQVSAANEALDGYLRGVIEDRRKSPRADLISDLVRVEDAGDRLTLDELLGTCHLLLNAGHETTVNLIGNGALALLENPAERAALAADPALLPGAVEELLRFESPVQMARRFVMEDTQLGDRAVKRGDLVFLYLGAANRDPEVFPHPATLDLRRPNAGAHLAFAAGIHYCLGARLAHLTGEIAFGALLRRFPGLALTGEPITWRPHGVLRCLEALPVKA